MEDVASIKSMDNRFTSSTPALFMFQLGSASCDQWSILVTYSITLLEVVSLQTLKPSTVFPDPLIGW